MAKKVIIAQREITVESQGGGKNATIKTRWTKTDYYCLHCGKQTVWQDDMDDYYEGYGLGCVSCRHEWSMPSDSAVNVNSMWAIRMTELIIAVAKAGIQ